MIARTAKVAAFLLATTAFVIGCADDSPGTAVEGGGGDGAAAAPAADASGVLQAGATVEFVATEFAFTPSEITAAPGDYHGVLTNDGTIAHDITVGDADPVTAQPGESVEFDFVVPEGGVAITCSVPGHADAGMHATISTPGSSPSTSAPPADGHAGEQLAAATVEPDPDAPKYCGVAQITCSSDADCPREFECVSHSTPCPEIACVGDEPDCPRCDPTTYEVCQPKHIACDGDDDCPADWSCGVFGSGGGVDVGEPQPTEPAPEPAFDERRSRTMSDADQRGACYPDALGGAGYVETDEARDAAPGGAEDSGSAAPGSNSSSGGGCSVGAVGASGAAGWLMTLLLVGPLARRRQRR